MKYILTDIITVRSSITVNHFKATILSYYSQCRIRIVFSSRLTQYNVFDDLKLLKCDKEFNTKILCM